MDLHFTDATPTDDETAAIDAVAGLPAPPITPRAARDHRHLLLDCLHAAQRRVGHLTEGALNHIARRLGLPPAEVYGVASFYALFSTTPRPLTQRHVCDDVVCRAVAPMTAEPGTRPSPCLGLCDFAPASLEVTAGPTPTERQLTRGAPLPAATLGGERRLLARVGVVNPASLQDFLAHGGGQALERALACGPAGVLAELDRSKLTGRGGAAFPAARKWQAVAQARGPVKYVVCNADESEPGTFKDRVLLEGDPYGLIEALTIAGLTVGAEQGFIYVRDEYPLAAERLQHAMAECRRAGRLGEVLGSRQRFDVRLVRGAGAYVCGEETALFNSIEGLRPEPRTKPPFPVEAGLFGQPTVINNVETLFNVLQVMTLGGEAFSKTGTAGSTGTKLFSVAGHVARPGVYEVPFGVSLKDLLGLAGGPRGTLKAVLLGGAAGSFLGATELDLPLTLEDARKAGATLGSGAVMVFDEGVDLLDVLRRIAGFFRDESCGQCVPCRVGTVRVEECLSRVAGKTPLRSWAEEKRLLAELSRTMRDASICGLGQLATTALDSALARFPLVPS